MTNPYLAARSVTRSFGPTRALRGADAEIARGEIVAVMGPSGSGKSTLLHCLAGVLTPDDGEVPDGRLLLTADEQVQAVDIDTGEIEVLVDLTGATGPQSAAAVENDLYVLAGGRLWHTTL